MSEAVVVVAEPEGAAGFKDEHTVFQPLFVARCPDAMIVVGPFMIDTQWSAAGPRGRRAEREQRQRDDRQCFRGTHCSSGCSGLASHRIRHFRYVLGVAAAAS